MAQRPRTPHMERPSYMPPVDQWLIGGNDQLYRFIPVFKLFYACRYKPIEVIKQFMGKCYAVFKVFIFCGYYLVYLYKPRKN